MLIKPRAALHAVVPYVPGAVPAESAGRPLKLASNENPFGPSPRAIEAARAALDRAERYPDGMSGLLRARLAERHGVATDQVLLGSGSDDIFYQLTRAYLEPGRRAVMARPPYRIHLIAAQSMGAEITFVPLRNHTHDLEAMAKTVRPQDCVFVTNPHNPTGTTVRPGDLRTFVESLPPSCLIIVDEAYYEFVDPAIRLTAIELLGCHPGLVVTRTFSKAYGLAGLRVGYAIGSAAVLEPVERIRPPFNVTSVSLAAAIAALEDTAHVEMTVRETAASMRILVEACERLGLSYAPSQANFLLIEDRDGWPTALLREGITVRPGATLGTPGWVRVSLARPDDMRRVIGVIEQTVRTR